MKNNFPTFDEFITYVDNHKSWFDVYEFFKSHKNKDLTNNINPIKVGDYVLGYIENKPLRGQLQGMRLRHINGYTYDIDGVESLESIDLEDLSKQLESIGVTQEMLEYLLYMKTKE